MKDLQLSMKKVFENAINSFSRFPVTIISAIIISIIAVIKISMGYQTDASRMFLLDIIQYSFLIGGVFSMFTVAYTEIKYDNNKQFLLYAHIAGFALALISFVLLYFFGQVTSSNSFNASSISISSLANSSEITSKRFMA